MFIQRSIDNTTLDRQHFLVPSTSSQALCLTANYTAATKPVAVVQTSTGFGWTHLSLRQWDLLFHGSSVPEGRGLRTHSPFLQTRPAQHPNVPTGGHEPPSPEQCRGGPDGGREGGDGRCSQANAQPTNTPIRGMAQSARQVSCLGSSTPNLPKQNGAHPRPLHVPIQSKPPCCGRTVADGMPLVAPEAPQ